MSLSDSGVERATLLPGRPLHDGLDSIHPYEDDKPHLARNPQVRPRHGRESDEYGRLPVSVYTPRLAKNNANIS